MDGGCIGMIVALVCLVAAAAFFSATETAYSSLNKIRLKNRVDNGEKGAKLAMKLVENYDRMLSTILIGSNIANIAAGSVGTVLFVRLLGGYGPTVSTVVITIVMLMFSEVTPKTLAKNKPEAYAISVAVVANFLMKIFTPLVVLVNGWQVFITKVSGGDNDEGITDEELIGLVEEAENEGGIDEHESDLIRAAIEFNDVEVGDILTPRVDVEAVRDDVTADELASLFAETGYSRIPVYHGSIDNIIGFIHEKNFYMARYRGRDNLTRLITPVTYTTTSAHVFDLLRTMQAGKNHMAVVVDEYGGTEGIITLEDIIEELVGEIWDEHDEIIEFFRKQADGTWLIECEANLDDMFELFDIDKEDDEEPDAVSVGGWVMEELERLPREGDHFLYENLDVTVANVSKRRVVQIRVKVLPKEEEDKD